MKIEVVYPQIELNSDPNALRQFGRAVEGSGFDHIVAYDRVLGAVHENRVPPLSGCRRQGSLDYRLSPLLMRS